MDDKEQKVITFKLSAEEAETLDAKANQAGKSRSDYLRMILFAPPEPASSCLEDLIKHAIYQINQTHNALYSIAEAEGKAARFLTTEELSEVYDRVRAEALRYAVEFPDSFATVQAEIAKMSK
jgi:Ribbon-helix-helix protein, copG family